MFQWLAQLNGPKREWGGGREARPAAGYLPHKAEVVSTNSCSMPAVYYVLFIKIAQKVVCRYLTLIRHPTGLPSHHACFAFVELA